MKRLRKFKAQERTEQAAKQKTTINESKTSKTQSKMTSDIPLARKVSYAEITLAKTAETYTATSNTTPLDSESKQSDSSTKEPGVTGVSLESTKKKDPARQSSIARTFTIYGTLKLKI